jgi:hypothetical protein
MVCTRVVMLAAGCAVTIACAKTTPAVLTASGSQVRVSTGTGLEDCEYLGDFVAGMGPRPLGGAWGSNQVRNLAAERGATDVVFDDTARGSTVGRGFRCP